MSVNSIIDNSRKERLVLLGVIVGAHGVKGEIILRSFTEKKKDIVDFNTMKDNGEKIDLKMRGVKSNGDIICSSTEITNRNLAEDLIGTKIYCPRSCLPEIESADEFYIDDICGMSIVDTSLNVIGKALAMHNFGAGDIVEIHLNCGNIEMYAFTKETFPVITDDYIVTTIASNSK